MNYHNYVVVDSCKLFFLSQIKIMPNEHCFSARELAGANMIREVTSLGYLSVFENNTKEDF